jgi:CDP-paratose 2-epimerase
MRLLITGGAGFVGANIACGLSARHPDWELTALDNLHRRGSELNLARLREAGVRFVHGDVRELDDLMAIGELDALLECSAEPSALAGFGGEQDYVVKTNLLGAYHCLELARQRSAQFLFLSTSRVYPIEPLRALAVHEGPTRLELASDQPIPGASGAGIAEEFPLHGARTLYGASKLAAELLIEEYRNAFGLQAVIDRCGVLAGPWQMGKVDQGVFTYWMLAHHFRRPLQYIGFGGQGKQVRDLLHVDDLLDLLEEQLTAAEKWDGCTVNVGGGIDCSLSLLETTEICREITGHDLHIGTDPETRPGDVPVYVSDCSALGVLTGWEPKRDARQILMDIHTWITANERRLEQAL